MSLGIFVMKPKLHRRRVPPDNAKRCERKARLLLSQRRSIWAALILFDRDFNIDRFAEGVAVARAGSFTNS